MQNIINIDTKSSIHTQYVLYSEQSQGNENRFDQFDGIHIIFN